MASLDSMLKGFARMKADVEQRHAQADMTYGGYRQLLEQRLARVLASLESPEEVADFLKRYHAAMEALS